MAKTKPRSALGDYPYPSRDDVEILTDPVDDWIADHSEEWSYKYPGKHIAVVDYAVVGVYDTFGAAYDEARSRYPEGDLTVFYVPREDELEMLL